MKKLILFLIFFTLSLFVFSQAGEGPPDGPQEKRDKEEQKRKNPPPPPICGGQTLGFSLCGMHLQNIMSH